MAPLDHGLCGTRGLYNRPARGRDLPPPPLCFRPFVAKWRTCGARKERMPETPAKVFGEVGGRGHCLLRLLLRNDQSDVAIVLHCDML